MTKKFLQFLVLFILVTGTVWASGFQLNENGAKAQAMASAFTGLANDVSAVFWNPAGITQLSGTQVMAGVALIAPSFAFRGPSPQITEYKLEDKIFTPFQVYISHQLSDQWFIGFGVNTPYGLGTKWKDNWVGRFLAIETDLKTFFFNPVIAYKISDKASISIGGSVAYGSVTIERDADLYPFAGEANVKLEGNGWAWGVNAALLFKPIEEVSIGITVRSESEFKFEGDAKSTGPAQFTGLLPGGDISANLTTPLNFTIGFAFFPHKDWTITTDFQYVGWESYDVLAVDFKDPKMTDLSSERLYQNTYIARLGLEYKASETLALRTGIYYDNNPVRDKLLEPSLPDADRIGFNFGIGYDLTDHLTLDLAYLYILFEERTIKNSEISYTPGFAPFNGVYNSKAHIMGINFSYKF